jgi:hypothetical protein
MRRSVPISTAQLFLYRLRSINVGLFDVCNFGFAIVWPRANDFRAEHFAEPDRANALFGKAGRTKAPQ